MYVALHVYISMCTSVGVCSYFSNFNLMASNWYIRFFETLSNLIEMVLNLLMSAKVVPKLMVRLFFSKKNDIGK